MNIKIIRSTPNIVASRGLAAIREWQQTDRPWLGLFGVSYHGYSDKGGRPNVIGFWAKTGSWYRFRPLKTLKVGQRVEVAT